MPEDQQTDHDRTVEMHTQLSQLLLNTACLPKLSEDIGIVKERLNWHWLHIRVLWGALSAILIALGAAIIKHILA